MSGLRFATSALASVVRQALFRASVIAGTSGLGHVLKLLPSLTTSSAEVEEVMEAIGEAAQEGVTVAGT
ncbi:hypothetical protein SAMN06272781_7872 [Streptomyces sp. 1222.2]|nr:hypothetical protein SAMN06272781_7872 [Streptomyces sp. 1222.2]